MTAIPEAEPIRPAAPSQARSWSFARLLAALVVTPTVLIYQWGMVLVLSLMDGRPPPEAVLTLAVGIAVVIVLTFRLSRRLSGFRFERFVPTAVGVTWIAVTALIISLYGGDTIPKAALVLLFVPATFWVAWLAWMFYRPWAWGRRLAGLAICMFLVAPFPLALKTSGLTGDARVNFVWRASPPELPDLLAATEGAVSLDALSPAHADDDFPQFLGPERTGVVGSETLLPDWKNKPPREVWRHAVGEGWGSFAVVGDFAVTQEQRGDNECIVCYRVADGAPVWTHAYPAKFDATTGGSNMGGAGPRATPSIVGGRVYAVGTTGILNCLEGSTGRLIWSKDIQKDNDGRTISHGVCGSPIVLGNRVIVAPTGNTEACLAAYDCADGSPVWSAGRHQASYSSPALAELAGRRQLLLFTDEGLDGHDAETGEFLWSHTWTNHVRVNCSQPLIVDGAAGRILLCTGYNTGSVLLEVASAGGEWSAREIWSRREMKTKFTTAVRIGEHVYGLDDGILACMSLADGTRLWKAGRYQHGQILLAGNLLLVQTESGDVVLVRPDPQELIELGRIPALSGKTWNNPALSGKYLLVRNDHEAACYELPME